MEKQNAEKKTKKKIKTVNCYSMLSTSHFVNYFHIQLTDISKFMMEI